MLSYSTILLAILPVFLLIGTGFFFHRKDWIGGESVETGTMKLVINFFYPCFILSVVPGNPALKSGGDAVATLGLGFLLAATGFGVAWLISRISGMKRGEGGRTFTLATGVQNYGYLPLPIIAEIFPAKSETLQGVTIVHGLGVELAMWTVGISILSGKANPKLILNGPFIATVTALILNFTGLHEFIPKLASNFFDSVGVCAIPVAIFMIGATIGRFFDSNSFRGFDAIRAGVVSCVVRIGIMAALFIAAAIYLPISQDLKQVLIIQGAMPAAVFPIVIARLYGGNPATAIQVVLATSFVSILTAPLVIALGLKWLGSG